MLLIFLLINDRILFYSDAKEVLKIAGWDVYADPNHPNKTIGFETFEHEHNVIIEFKLMDEFFLKYLNFKYFCYKIKKFFIIYKIKNLKFYLHYNEN